MIKILVDSASDCRENEKLYDYFMPISISIGGKEYKDGIDLNADKFYSLLAQNDDFPKTSQPSPADFAEIFEEVKRERNELIYFALSSALSGTYQGACLAKEMVDYDGIYIIDTKTVSHMIGLLANFAKELIEQGESAKSIVSKCENLKGRIRAFAGVDTLEYLYKGGRLSRGAATVGKIVDIKPIVTVTVDGEVSAVGKALGKGRAMQFICERVESLGVDENFPIYSLYTNGTDNCLLLEEKLAQKGYKAEHKLQIGSTIGAHIGPGVYAVMFVAKE